MSWMFKLRGPVSPTQRFLCEIIGAVIFVCLWWLLSGVVQSSLVPHPSKVFTAFGDLYRENNLIQNLFLSIGLNLSGYTIALLLTIPIGFAIGLIPIFRATFQRLIDAIRFLPLTAVPGIFIIAFGIGVPMKANFLAFGIFIFMLPVVVQRIDEVKDVYLKTVYTIGATNWQTIRSVYLPSVISRFFDDIRVLTAISWTYIVFAELIASQGGLGYLTFAARKQGRFDKLYALLLIFILIGIIQDKLFVRLDREFFPHKYQTKNKYSTESEKAGLLDSILDFAGGALLWIFLATYFFLAINEFIPILGDIKVLDYLFGASVWSIHLLFLSILAYKLYNLYIKRVESQEQILIADAGVSG